jgi:excisionase family DNA binding protein
MQPEPSPWLTVDEAAARARVGKKTIYREIKSGRLRAAVVGNRRAYRLLVDWVDQWLIASTEPREIRRVG